MTCMECKFRRPSPYSKCGGLYDCGLTGRPIMRPEHESCDEGRPRGEKEGHQT